jgi:hypothetical protein
MVPTGDPCRPADLTLKYQRRGTSSARPELTTNPDHNRNRHEPILADSPWLQSQVSDGIRQPARILQAGGRGFESP